LDRVFDAYLATQRQLAADDPRAATAAAAQLQQAWGGVTTDGLPVAAVQAMTTAARNAAAATDLDALRQAFAALSQALLAIHAEVGQPGRQPLYRVHCPMAFDNQGADWIQAGRQVTNPYFGARMLRCGEVRATLPGSDGK
jgi:Cu(I)/Ag(I) efflux system membrane fusion protein